MQQWIAVFMFIICIARTWSFLIHFKHGFTGYGTSQFSSRRDSNVYSKTLLTQEQEVNLCQQYLVGQYVRKERERLLQELGRDPTNSEVALATGKSVVEIEEAESLGDLAHDKLFDSNIRLVVHIAKNYKTHSLSFEELVNVGIVGLLRSIEKFDPSRGFRFSTYAAWWIKQSISRELAENARLVKIPNQYHGDITKMHKAEAEFFEDHDRKPTSYELARLMETSVERVERLLSLTSPIQSIEDRVPTILKSGNSQSRGDMLQSDNYEWHEEQMEQEEKEEKEDDMILMAMKLLPKREAKVIELRFGVGGTEPMTLEAIGTVFGFTRERIRQILKSALESLNKLNVDTSTFNFKKKSERWNRIKKPDGS